MSKCHSCLWLRKVQKAPAPRDESQRFTVTPAVPPPLGRPMPTHSFPPTAFWLTADDRYVLHQWPSVICQRRLAAPLTLGLRSPLLGATLCSGISSGANFSGLPLSKALSRRPCLPSRLPPPTPLHHSLCKTIGTMVIIARKGVYGNLDRKGNYGKMGLSIAVARGDKACGKWWAMSGQ